MLSRVRRPVPFIGHTRARTIVVAGGVLLGLVVACAAIWLLIELRHKDISDNERELKNTALILAEEIESGFQAAELIELNVIEHMRQQGIDSPEEFARQMGSRDEYE